MSIIKLLHLSDFHFGHPDGVIQARQRDRRQAFFDFLNEHCKSTGGPDFIFVTGDLAFSGEKEQYEKYVKGFFSELMCLTSVPPERVFVVPGNHDVDDSLISYSTYIADKGLNSNKFNSWMFSVKDDDRQELENRIKRLDNYIQFIQSMNLMHNDDGNHPLWYKAIIPVLNNSKKVGVVGLSTAILARSQHKREEKVMGGDEDRRCLLVGSERADKLVREIGDCDLRIVLFHHPFDWLKDDEIDKIKMAVCSKCHLILRGHMHKGRYEFVKEPGYNYHQIACDAWFESENGKGGVNWIEIDLDENKGKMAVYQYLNDYFAISPYWPPNPNELNRDGFYEFSIRGQNQIADGAGSSDISRMSSRDMLDQLVKDKNLFEGSSLVIINALFNINTSINPAEDEREFQIKIEHDKDLAEILERIQFFQLREETTRTKAEIVKLEKRLEGIWKNCSPALKARGYRVLAGEALKDKPPDIITAEKYLLAAENVAKNIVEHNKETLEKNELMKARILHIKGETTRAIEILEKLKTPSTWDYYVCLLMEEEELEKARDVILNEIPEGLDAGGLLNTAVILNMSVIEHTKYDLEKRLSWLDLAYKCLVRAAEKEDEQARRLGFPLGESYRNVRWLYAAGKINRTHAFLNLSVQTGQSILSLLDPVFWSPNEEEYTAFEKSREYINRCLKKYTNLGETDGSDLWIAIKSLQLLNEFFVCEADKSKLQEHPVSIAHQILHHSPVNPLAMYVLFNLKSLEEKKAKDVINALINEESLDINTFNILSLLSKNFFYKVEDVLQKLWNSRAIFEQQNSLFEWVLKIIPYLIVTGKEHKAADIIDEFPDDYNNKWQRDILQGVFYLEKEEWLTAANYIRQAWEKTKHPREAMFLVDLLKRCNDWKSISEVVRELFKKFASPYLRESLFSAEFNAQNWDAVIDLFKSFPLEEQKKPDNVLRYGLAALKMGLFSEAFNLLKQLPGQIQPTHSHWHDLWHVLINAAVRIGRWEDSVAYAREWIDRSVRPPAEGCAPPDPYFHLANYYLRIGDNNEAHRWARLAHDRFESEIAVALNYMTIAFKTGYDREGSEVLQKYGQQAQDKGLLQVKPFEEMIEWIKGRSEMEASVWEQYQNSILPIHFPCALLNYNIASLWWRNLERNADQTICPTHPKPALFAVPGGWIAPDWHENKRFAVDITALLTLSYIGMLKPFLDWVEVLYGPAKLIDFLLLEANHLQNSGQESIRHTLEAIERAVTILQIKIGEPLADNEIEINEILQRTAKENGVSLEAAACILEAQAVNGIWFDEYLSDELSVKNDFISNRARIIDIVEVMKNKGRLSDGKISLLPLENKAPSLEIIERLINSFCPIVIERSTLHTLFDVGVVEDFFQVFTGRLCISSYQQKIYSSELFEYRQRDEHIRRLDELHKLLVESGKFTAISLNREEKVIDILKHDGGNDLGRREFLLRVEFEGTFNVALKQKVPVLADDRFMLLMMDKGVSDLIRCCTMDVLQWMRADESINFNQLKESYCKLLKSGVRYLYPDGDVIYEMLINSGVDFDKHEGLLEIAGYYQGCLGSNGLQILSYARGRYDCEAIRFIMRLSEVSRKIIEKIWGESVLGVSRRKQASSWVYQNLRPRAQLIGRYFPERSDLVSLQAMLDVDLFNLGLTKSNFGEDENLRNAYNDWFVREVFLPGQELGLEYEQNFCEKWLDVYRSEPRLVCVFFVDMHPLIQKSLSATTKIGDVFRKAGFGKPISTISFGGNLEMPVDKWQGIVEEFLAGFVQQDDFATPIIFEHEGRQYKVDIDLSPYQRRWIALSIEEAVS